ncbi:MAG: hypothetical protein D6798_07915, partial [Deltaproteobacteria bacterium]
DDAFFRGDDLLGYPRRLGMLQQRLVEQHGETLRQADRLDARRAVLAERPDRVELARRYAEDAALLRRRADRMARVLGLVWKTRALLVLRAHVAITARRRPRLSALPEGEIPVEGLAAAAAEYDAASLAVRAFVDELDSRANDLDQGIPRIPDAAVVTDEIRAAVEAERVHAAETYASMRARMDELADTLAYLAERCRTRQVVEGGQVGVDAGEGSEVLVDELNDALAALADLAVVGDRRLADAALDNLTEDIGQLEQAGLDAQAETDAVLEVQRLLEQFTQGR